MKYFRSPLVIKSFAKLNLYLQVLNKRKDNFHNLNTLFTRIDLADTLVLKERKDNLIKIKCSSRQVPKDKTNLCYRAAVLLKQECKLNFGLEIDIKKRIPVGAGLGGGSTNAASLLLGLNKYWNLNLPKTALIRLAAKLGSDVAFFVHDIKFALGSQRGEKIKPLVSLQQLKLWFILVYPNIKVSTPLVYQQFELFSRLTRQKHNVKLLVSQLLKRGSQVTPELLFNSLETVTIRLYPVVNQVKKALYDMGLEKVMMSGSGAAVFGICSSLKQAKDLSKKLRKQHKSWQVFVTSTV